MSEITTTEIERLSRLAHIGVSAAEANSLVAELSAIVGFVEQLGAVDVDGVEPTDQVTGLTNVWRSDTVRPSLPRASLLANAPAQADGSIVVKRVLGG